MQSTSNRTAQALSCAVYPIARVINAVGVGILAVMMFLITADVFLRYVFNRPILGSYELTQLMMAILVVFALAYTGVNKGHIVIDVFLSRFSPRVQSFLNSITWLIAIGIYSLITWRSIIYAELQREVGTTTAALYIPIYPFIYLVALGSAVLCLVFVVELINHLGRTVVDKKIFIKVILLLGIALITLMFTVPAWGEGMPVQISPVTAGFFGIALLIVLTFSGMYVGIVLGLLGFMGMVYVNGLGAGLSIMGTTPFSEVSSYTMSVLPLFILMGEFCFYSGLSQDLYATAYRWLGHLPGGLAVATIGACAGFAAVCGSSLAEAATMGAVALPEMKKRKYDSALATGAIACGGCLGILIPPSTTLVIYGIITEQSIGKLFLAGFIPGVIQAVFFMTAIYIQCKRNPLLGPPGEKSRLIEKLLSLKDTWAVLALFLLVIGGMYRGVFTPTEAAGVGAFGAFVLALGKRKLTWGQFKNSLQETGKTTAMTFFLLIGATLFGYFLTVTRLPFELANLVSGLAVSRYVIFGTIVLVYLFLGCIMSSIVMIVITVPIFLPVLLALGFDPIWFGIMVVVMVEIAQITPPYAINVFIIHSVAKDVPMYTIYRGIVPFLMANFVLVVLLTAFPEIVLFIPNLMK